MGMGDFEKAYKWIEYVIQKSYIYHFNKKSSSFTTYCFLIELFTTTTSNIPGCHDPPNRTSYASLK
jgi:hypothetical protein